MDEARTLAGVVWAHAFGTGIRAPQGDDDAGEDATWNGQLLSVSVASIARVALPELVAMHLPLLWYVHAHTLTCLRSFVHIK